MALIDILRSGVAIADAQTKSLQTIVSFEKHLGDDGYGNDTYAPVQYLPALCDWRAEQVRTQQGELTVTRMVLTFLNVHDLARVTNNEGIREEDRLTLPDGSTGPILDLSGFLDPGNCQPLATEVKIG